MDLDEVRKGCEEFGNILKVYTWTSKKSSTPQAYVVFDSPTAVTRATQSLLNHTSPLWKNGYHMLKMCESTSWMIENFFKQDGITRDDPLFANIPVNKPSKPWATKKHPAVRGEQEPSTTTRSIPTGPRYRPYSLNDRPDTSSSAQASNPVTFPPKKDPPSPESPKKPLAQRRTSFGSPTPKFVPNKNWLGLARSPSPAAKPVVSPPSPVSLRPPPSSPPMSPRPPMSNLGDIDEHQLNLKLQSDIRDLVSDRVDAAREAFDMQLKTENLQHQLQVAKQELVQLRSSVEAAKTREEALASRLSKAEADRDGAQEACTQALEGIKALWADQQTTQAAKLQLEAELQQLRGMYGAVQAQLAQAQAQLRSQLMPPKHTAEVGVQSESFRADTEDASSVEPDDACATPAPTDHDQHSLPTKPDQHDFTGFLDAFNDIDNLVRGVFSRPESSFMTT
ncbi:hypothetical protein FRC12_005689 [Ceratobasidium sp. 428]|nr:hypothetical protein FRC12_005689 [Ceratobasidium sp. 428]